MGERIKDSLPCYPVYVPQYGGVDQHEWSDEEWVDDAVKIWRSLNTISNWEQGQVSSLTEWRTHWKLHQKQAVIGAAHRYTERQ